MNGQEEKRMPLAGSLYERKVDCGQFGIPFPVHSFLLFLFFLIGRII
jgi:hypothetical protein